MHALYVAYGSNLSLERMRARVPSARVVGPGLLRGARLRLDKRGADGSGKANLATDRDAWVWGVAYRLAAADFRDLDAVEPGYRRVTVELEVLGRSVSAQTYRSERLTADPVAFEWYKRLIVEGARQHGLPDDYVIRLEALPARPDPRRRPRPRCGGIPDGGGPRGPTRRIGRRGLPPRASGSRAGCGDPR